MNHELLITHFNRIGDVPEAIPDLRRFIFQLAVRGKIVGQDPGEEPASELLSRIRSEKAELTEEGRATKYQHLEPSTVEDPPYEIPPSWKWVKLVATVNRHFGGGTPSKNIPAYWGGGILWASVKDVGKDKYIEGTIDRITEAGLADSSSNLIPPGNLIVVTRMGLGKVSINRVPIAINQDLRALCLSSLTLIDYHYIFFRTHGFAGTGLTVKGIKVEELLNVNFPLPPLAEQRRIVAKVDELMVLCDRLETIRNERDGRRHRLTAASYYHLEENNDAIGFRGYAKNYLKHLPQLTSEASQISALRGAILNFAVRGRLVSQNANDEPASILLERLSEEIGRYCREQRIAPPRPEPIKESEIPYPAPRGWIWGRLCSMFKVITDGDHQPPPKEQEGVAFLTIGNVTTGFLDFSNCRFVSPSYLESVAEYRKPSFGDILYTVVGATYGRPVLVDSKRPFCVQRHIAILKPPRDIDIQFLRILLASRLVYSQATKSATGAAQPTVALKPLRNFLVPLPPLAEQHRIVSKVDELMKLCDLLEAQLTAAQNDRRRLLESMLHLALAGARVPSHDADGQASAMALST